MKKILVGIIIPFTFSTSSIAQEKQSDEILIVNSVDTLGVQFGKLDGNCLVVNQTDSTGRKIGPWVDVAEPLIKNITLSDSSGKRITSWIEKPSLEIEFYNDSGEMSTIISFGCYDNKNVIISHQDTWINCKARGPLIQYHPNGLVMGLVNILMPNKDFIGAQRNYFKEVVFPYQGYCYNFYDDGNIESEGWMIFTEDYLIDCEEVGIWKYYSPDGKMKIVDYSKLYPINETPDDMR